MSDKIKPVTFEPFCTFCGAGSKEVKYIIAGPSVYICNDCVDLCVEIIKEREIKDEKIKDEKNRQEEQSKSVEGSEKEDKSKS